MPARLIARPIEEAVDFVHAGRYIAKHFKSRPKLILVFPIVKPILHQSPPIWLTNSQDYTKFV